MAPPRNIPIPQSPAAVQEIDGWRTGDIAVLHNENGPRYIIVLSLYPAGTRLRLNYRSSYIPQPMASFRPVLPEPRQRGTNVTTLEDLQHPQAGEIAALAGNPNVIVPDFQDSLRQTRLKYAQRPKGSTVRLSRTIRKTCGYPAQ